MGAGMSLSRRRILLNEPHIATASGRVASFSTDMSAPLKSCLIGIEPVQEGSGDPSPENVRPISGWTGAKVTRTGKNLFDIDSSEHWYYTANSVKTFNDNSRSVIIPCKPGDIFTLSAAAKTSGIHYIAYADSNGLILNRQGTSGAANITLTAPQNAAFCYAGVDGIANFTNLQFELGSTATAYKPYAGNTYTIQLGDTVYGGTLDVVTGVLTATWVELDMGDLEYTYDPRSGGRNGFTTEIGNIKPASDNVLLSALSPIYKPLKYQDTWTDNSMSYRKQTGKTVIFMYNAYDDADLFRAAMSGVKIVYELATPVTYQLTPTQITALIGQNNIWADTGSTQAKYWTH